VIKENGKSSIKKDVKYLLCLSDAILGAWGVLRTHGALTECKLRSAVQQSHERCCAGHDPNLVWCFCLCQWDWCYCVLPRYHSKLYGFFWKVSFLLNKYDLVYLTCKVFGVTIKIFRAWTLKSTQTLRYYDFSQSSWL